VLLAGVATACSDSLAIGFSCELTGIHSETGVSGRNGAEIAVAMLSERGRRVALTVKDDEGRPERAAEIDAELAAAGVRLIVGHTRSVLTAASIPGTESDGYLLLSPYSNGDLVVGRDDGFFSLLPPAEDQAAALAGHAVASGFSSAVCVFDPTNLAFSQGLSESFGAVFESAGGGILFSVSADSSDPVGIDAACGRIASAAPDCVLLTGNVVYTAVIAQRLRAKGYGGQLYGSDAAIEPSLAANGGQAVLGMVFAHIFDAENLGPEASGFAEAYERRFRAAPSISAYLGAEAVLVLAEAARRDRSPAGVKRALLAGDFKGLVGPVRFDAEGDAVRPYLLMELVESGFMVLR